MNPQPGPPGAACADALHGAGAHWQWPRGYCTAIGAFENTDATGPLGSLMKNQPAAFIGSAGPGAGDWRLEVSSDLDIDVLPYVRSQTGLIEAGQPERR